MKQLFSIDRALLALVILALFGIPILLSNDIKWTSNPTKAIAPIRCGKYIKNRTVWTKDAVYYQLLVHFKGKKDPEWVACPRWFDFDSDSLCINY